MSVGDSDIPGRLWVISSKLFGVGELIKIQNNESSALNQDEVNFGIGEIITDLAKELATLRKEFEAHGYVPTKNASECNVTADDEHEQSEKKGG